MGLKVEETDDETSILPLLEIDRTWAAYALCDLDPPYRQNARLVAAFAGADALAVILLYSLPGVTAVLPYGNDRGIEAIFSEYDLLPHEAILFLRHDRLSLVRSTYYFPNPMEMWRMVVSKADFRPFLQPNIRVVRLTPADAPRLHAFYSRWEHVEFIPEMLEYGIYYAAESSGEIIAVAGTHVVSHWCGLAAIGGVLTHPEWRGRGLATAVTGGVVSALLDIGIESVFLNVRQDNAPAVAAYRRLGFTTYAPMLEGGARLIRN